MKAISPISITDSMISNYTSVADWSGLVWTSGTAYVSGDVVLISGTHDLYFCQYDYSGTTSPKDNPLDGSGNAYWIPYGVENKYKLFDSKTRSKTVNAGPINLEVTPEENVNSIALLGFVLDYLKITITSASEVDPIFEEEIELSDLSVIGNDYYNWHFVEPTPIEQFIKIDLPTYSDYTIKIESSNSSGDAEIGEIIIGSLLEIGQYQYGSSYEDEDYSTKERDTFGNAQTLERDFASVVNYQVIVFSENVYRVKRFLSSNRTTGILYIGNIDIPHSIVYGFYNSYSIVESNVSFNDVVIEVEELI